MLRITNVIGNMNRHTLSIWLTLLVWISWPCSWKGSSLNFKLENQTFIRLSTFDTNTLFLWIFCSMHAIRLVVLGWSFLEDCKVKKIKDERKLLFIIWVSVRYCKHLGLALKRLITSITTTYTYRCFFIVVQGRHLDLGISIIMTPLGEKVNNGKLDKSRQYEDKAHCDIKVEGSGIGNTRQFISGVKGKEGHG